jgi:hypothetical protein
MNKTDKPVTTTRPPRRTARYSGPRLVVGGASGANSAAIAQREQVHTCAVLRSAIADKTPIVLSVLTNLFGGLREGERIDFVHQIARPRHKHGVGKASYQLLVMVACPPHRHSDLSATVAEALVTAYPGYHMEPVTDSSVFGIGPSLPYTAQFAPSGAIVAPKPPMTKFEETAWQQSPALSSMLAGEQTTPQQVWPYPGRLANWALTAPLYEPMELPDALEVTVRIHGFNLSDEACQALHKTLQRVLAGNLCAFHPGSPVASYSASAELGDSAATLVRHWLRHPSSGYAIDCVVRSSHPLGEVAERRIVGDVLGDRPFELLRRFDDSAPQPFAAPTLAWANTPDQGIPALMPGQVLLPTLGVPAHYPAPVLPPPRSGARLGASVCGRDSAPVHLPFGSRDRHVALFGATGSGKSSLLLQMLIADITDPDRRCGVALIDPHGTLVKQILERIPRHRAEDVVVVDVSDPSHTVSLNPLEGMRDDPQHAQFITGEMMSIIEKLMEGKNTSGPVLTNNLRHLLLLAGGRSDRHGTFQDAYRILTDHDYFDWLAGKCRDQNVVDYWRRFQKTRGDESGFAAWFPYIVARLSPFVTSPIMQRLLNRPDSTIDLDQAMRDRKIVLFNLSRGVLQDIECQVLGSLILMKFFSAAVRRALVPDADRAPMHLYVDEFQTFATDSVPRLFTEARKFGLYLTTANQSLGQLTNRWGRSNIAEQVLANTATKFLFRLGPSDIETLQPYFRPHFNADQMANLPDFHAVACMSDNNRPLPPFVLQTDSAESATNAFVPAADLIEHSRARYAVPIPQANRELMKIHNLSAESLGMVGADVEVSEAEEKSPSLFTQLFNEHLNS